MNSPWREFKIKSNLGNTYRLWNGGLFNQLISLETAVGISYLLNNEIHIHDMRRLPSCSKTFDEKDNYITDFVDMSKYHNIFFSKQKINLPSKEQIHVENLMNTFIPVIDDDYNSNFFSEGRKKLILNSNMLYYFNNNLSYYSIMFFNKTKEFNLYIKQLNFKKEYLDLANFIFNQIGNFNGIHLRQTDFSQMIYSVTKEEYDNSIQKLKETNSLILLCTDDLESPIVKNDGSVLFIDNLIKDNFMKEFNQLTVSSKISFDLICMLVMCKSSDFIGTIGSTYSGLIHRNVNQSKQNNHHWTNMGDYDNIPGHPFSWNSYDKISIGKKLWWREWKESYI